MSVRVRANITRIFPTENRSNIASVQFESFEPFLRIIQPGDIMYKWFQSVDKHSINPSMYIVLKNKSKIKTGIAIFELVHGKYPKIVFIKMEKPVDLGNASSHVDLGNLNSQDQNKRLMQIEARLLYLTDLVEDLLRNQMTFLSKA